MRRMYGKGGKEGYKVKRVKERPGGGGRRGFKQKGCRGVGSSVLARHIPKGTVPFGASNVSFGVGLKTTLCPSGVQQLPELLKGAE